MHPLSKLLCAGTAASAVQWWSVANAAGLEGGSGGGGNTAGWNSVDEFFQDHSAWIAFRKRLEPSPTVGVGYPVTVKLEVRNLGKREARDLTVSDAWNSDEFRIDIPQPSERLDFTLNSLLSGESHTFEYQVIPLQIGQLSVSRANMTYEESPSSTISGLSSSMRTVTCVSASRFSRLNGWVFPWIIMFILLVVVAIVLPIHSLIFKCNADENTFRRLFPFVFHNVIDRLPSEYRAMILRSLATAVKNSRRIQGSSSSFSSSSSGGSRRSNASSKGSSSSSKNNNNNNNANHKSSAMNNSGGGSKSSSMSANGSGRSSSKSSSKSSSGQSSGSSSKSKGKQNKGGGGATKRR